MKVRTVLSVMAFVACVPLSNWMLSNVGVCGISGPCLVPVLPGLWAPSAVLLVGLTLVLRDLVQRECGAAVSAGLVLLGAGLSLLVASRGLAIASGVAFLMSEFVDFGVYTAVERRSRSWAVLLSGAAGAAADSILFLWLAFGDVLTFLPGQIVGKLWASLLAFVVLRYLARSRVVGRPA
jgi:queuosine precursor transporter